MKHKSFYDPYVELLAALNKAKVEYLVVGMSGINYYALNAKETFTTQDFDIFINPTISNVDKAVAVFTKLGYGLMVDEKELDKSAIKDVINLKRTIAATSSYGILFELILAVSGYTFSQMAYDARIFNSGKIPIKVAQLRKLLKSKKLAGRKKDILFLKRYSALLEEF